MIEADIHTHSISSGHGSANTITHMAKAASNNGLKLLGISDHGPATVGSGTPSYFRSLKLAPRERFGVELWYGVELNILDYKGHVDLDKSILATLDYGIISMHTANLKPGTVEENTNAYIQAMKLPGVRIIGHCDDERYPVDYEQLVMAAREYHVLPEINNVSLGPDNYRGNTRKNLISLLQFCRSYHLPILLSSDSHGVNQVGNVELCLAFLEESSFPKELVINRDITKLKNWFRI